MAEAIAGNTVRRVPKEMELARARLVSVARMENSDKDTCPLCKNPYKISEANGVPVRTCLEDRIVMPIEK